VVVISRFGGTERAACNLVGLQNSNGKGARRKCRNIFVGFDRETVRLSFSDELARGQSLFRRNIIQIADLIFSSESRSRRAWFLLRIDNGTEHYSDSDSNSQPPAKIIFHLYFLTYRC